MPEELISDDSRLEAKDPFELRVNLGADVPETTVRSALATGDMGFLHSFTDAGATLDGPGVRVIVWTSGCTWRCLYCHNPTRGRRRTGGSCRWRRRSTSCAPIGGASR